MSCNMGGGGMSEQLINLRPAAESLAWRAQFAGPDLGAMAGVGLEKEAG